MKFMVNWQFHEGRQHETLAMFAAMTPEQDDALRGEKIQLIGRWHDVAGASGVAIFETDCVASMTAYSLKWNHVMDLDITPVLDDDETRAIGRQLAASA